jgi:hypothetical protein
MGQFRCSAITAYALSPAYSPVLEDDEELSDDDELLRLDELLELDVDEDDEELRLDDVEELEDCIRPRWGKTSTTLPAPLAAVYTVPIFRVPVAATRPSEAA